MADRYITVDFTGRRQFTLVETESARWSDYIWNDGKGLYNIYRETIDFGTVESVSIWYNNLPEGRQGSPNAEVRVWEPQARCVIGPVKALPMVAGTVRNPVVTINGKTIVFPVEMPSGSYLELNTSSDCVLYGSKGEVIANLSPQGPMPLLSAGENQIQFSSDTAAGPAPRVRLTISSRGQPL